MFFWSVLARPCRKRTRQISAYSKASGILRRTVVGTANLWASTASSVFIDGANYFAGIELSTGNVYISPKSPAGTLK